MVFEASRADWFAHVDRGVVVKESSLPDAGKGSFWTGPGPLPANKTIGVYKGDVIDDKEYDRRRANPENKGAYVFVADCGTMIDGFGRKHWTAYANDGTPSGVRNNMRFNGKGHYITMHKVNVGDELLGDYGDTYW